MRLLNKIGLGLMMMLVSIAIAPSVKADPIVIKTDGFALHGLGNNGSGLADVDSLIGAASSNSINFSGPGKTKCVAVRRCSQDTNHALGSAKFASRYVSNCFVSSFGVDTANP